MSSDIPDFENVAAVSSSRSSDGALRSVGAKSSERDNLASDVEAFLAGGGQIKTVQNGVSAQRLDAKDL